MIKILMRSVGAIVCFPLVLMALPIVAIWAVGAVVFCCMEDFVRWAFERD